MKKRFPKLYGGLMVIGIILAVVIIAAACTGMVIMQHSSGSEGEFTYLVVLGTTVNGTEPSPMLRDRIGAAYTYLTEHEDVICIVSGALTKHGSISEAQCMYNTLVDMGIPHQRIWIEDKATSTRENLQYALELIEEKTGTRPDTIGIVSSEFHLLRAEMFAQEQQVTPVTVSAKTSHTPTFVRYFLREILMVWYYGTIG